MQILYYTDGETAVRSKEDQQPDPGVIQYKGHEFLDIHFRTPTTCDSCNNAVWHMINPPKAIECKSECLRQFPCSEELSTLFSNYRVD